MKDNVQEERSISSWAKQVYAASALLVDSGKYKREGLTCLSFTFSSLSYRYGYSLQFSKAP
jgi:hypothetical protein